jgi:asparagine synthetase B (glutamine-hydrolysing)
VSAGALRLTLYTPEADTAPWLTWQPDDRDGRLTLCEGLKLSGETGRRLKPGTYNEIIIDGRRGEVTLHNDILAVLPLYFATLGQTLIVGNALPRIQEMFSLPHNELGVAQLLLLAGWTPGESTRVRGVHIAAAGTQVTFSAACGWNVTRERLSRAWSGAVACSNRAAVAEASRLWQQALDRTVSATGEPLGILLSGGLDSRLVAGGYVAAGVPLVAVSHGDPHSDEVRIAQSVAQTLGVPWLVNPLDDRFPYDALDLRQIQADLDRIFNPIFSSSGRLLAEHGVRSFTTGAGLDRLLGGRTHPNRVYRFLHNVALPQPARGWSRPVSPAGIDLLVGRYERIVAKRFRNALPLLTPSYREMIGGAVPAVLRSIRDELERFATDGRPTLDQIAERMTYEQWEKQGVTPQQHQLMRYGLVLYPSYDVDFVEYLSNLPPAMKFDHHLYYQVIRRLYPALAALPVPNLGTGVDRPRLVIETTRAWQTLRRRRPTSWVNYEAWLLLGDRLDRHRQEFLEQDHFFDPAAIDATFEAFRDGRRRFYDGNELLAYLSLAMSLRPGASLPSGG